MNFLIHPVLDLDEPIIYINHKIYSIGKKKDRHGDYLAYKNNCFELIRINEASNLDKLHHIRNKEAFEEYKKSFIKQTANQNLKRRDDILDDLCNDQLLKLIVGKVLPKLTGEQLEENIKRLMGASTEEDVTRLPRSNNKGKDLLQRLHINNLMTAHDYTTLTDFFNAGFSTIDIIFEDDKFIKLDSNIYQGIPLKEYAETVLQREISEGRTIEDYIELFNASNKKDLINKINGIIVTVDDTSYIFNYKCTKEEASDSFNETYCSLLKVEAAHQYDIQISEGNIRRHLGSVIQKEEYEKNGAGFIKEDHRYIVFVKTGTYNINTKSSTYRFPSATVAVQVYSHNGRIYVSGPMVLNRYSHPFLAEFDKERQRICLGYFRTESLENLSDDERIVTTISKGIETLRFGYHKNHSEGFKPYHNISEFKNRGIK